MRYLERFDLFGGEYEKMKRSDFVKNLSNVGMDLSEEKRIKLSKIFQGFFLPKSIGINSLSVKLRPDECFFYEVVKVGYFFIYPYDDEWYFIEFYDIVSEGRSGASGYYKCDGLEGIKQMLSDFSKNN